MNRNSIPDVAVFAGIAVVIGMAFVLTFLIAVSSLHAG